MNISIIGPIDELLLEKNIDTIVAKNNISTDFIICKVKHYWDSNIATAFEKKELKGNTKTIYYFFIKITKDTSNPYSKWKETILSNPSKDKNIIAFCNNKSISFIPKLKGRKKKALLVVGEGYGCDDKQYIQCSVKNMWDFKTKVTAKKDSFSYYFQKYTRKEYVDYKGQKQVSWDVEIINQPKEYPEILEYCNEYDIKLI